MIKRFKSKALVLTVLLATGATLAQTNTTPSDQPAQTTEQTQVAASSVKLELFSDQPSGSSQPLTTLEVGANGGNLGTIEVPNQANKGRYLRISVTSAAGVQTYLYRVIAAPSTGRVFVITPDRHAIALNKFLISSGLEVSKDKAVKLGAQASFSSDATTPASPTASTSKAAPAASTPSDSSATTPSDSSTTMAAPSDTSTTTTPSDTGTTTATPSDSSTATAPADTSASAPADSSTTSTTPSDSSTTTTTTPADSSTTTAPAASSTTTPADTSAPADSSTTTATAPSDSSSAGSADAKALTEPVNTTLGNVQLSVVPTGATAPQSSASNFILVPVADAKDAKSMLAGNVVTLSYASASSLEEVSKFYDDQLKAQGFVRDDANAANQTSADQVVSVYKRGNASVTITMRAENGSYTVTVDLGNLAQATGN